MPGLIDLHFHTALGKGYNDHLPLWEYLDECWYPHHPGAGPEAAYWAALRELHRGRSRPVSRRSTTCTASSARSPRPPRRSVSGRCCPATSRCPSMTSTPWPTTSMPTRPTTVPPDGRIEVGSASSGCPSSLALLRDARALADELGTGVHIHLNESMSEVEDSIERFGTRPTERRLRGRAAGPGRRRRALGLPRRQRDQPDRARPAHTSRTTPPRTPSSATGSPASRKCCGRHQRRPRPRRRRVQQQRRHVRGA